MVTSPTLPPAQREQNLLGQTLVVIGGSAGIGFETARLAHEEGAEVIITARDPDRLHRPASSLAQVLPHSIPPTSTGSRSSSTGCPDRSTTCW